MLLSLAIWIPIAFGLAILAASWMILAETHPREARQPKHGSYLRDYVGRPSPLYLARRLTEHAGLPVTSGTKFLYSRWIRESRWAP